VATWLDAVRSEVYALLESAVPGLTTTYDEVGAQRVSWRELVEAFQQGDTSRMQMEPPWAVIEWGELEPSDEYAITGDTYRWPISIVIAFSQADIDGGSDELKTVEVQMQEAEAAIEALRVALRGHAGPYAQFPMIHIGNHDAKNPANALFLEHNLPFHGVVFDAVVVCGVTP
jgi:hypothetical protein